MKGRALTALVAPLALAGFASANLVVNGSFELGDFEGDVNDAMALGDGAIALEGWEVFGPDIAWIGGSNAFDITASDGERSMDLSGYGDGPAYGGIRQTVNTTMGQAYQLRFDLGVHGNFGDVARIGIICWPLDGDISLHLSDEVEGQEWKTYVLDFTATSSFTELSFWGIAPSGNYIGIDNVTMEAVPEPGTLAAMGLGLLLGRRRFRRSR